MENLLLWVGRVAALAGVLICGIAVYVRLGGNYSISGFQVGTVLQAGATAMLFACVFLLLVLTGRPRR